MFSLLLKDLISDFYLQLQTNLNYETLSLVVFNETNMLCLLEYVLRSVELLSNEFMLEIDNE